MTTIDDDTMRTITTHIIDGLTANTVERKQWELETVLKLLVPDEFDDCKKDWGWEPGRWQND